MIQRRQTKKVMVGNVPLGCGHEIVVQTMTKVFTRDVEACVRQIRKVVKAGAGLVRVAVPTRADTRALAKIIERVDVPIIADVHFSRDRAIEAIEAGAAKIRLNPGNIKDPGHVAEIIAAAKANSVAIRVGVNEASIRDLKGGDIAPRKRVELMVKEMAGYLKMFRRRKFEDIVLSAKSADTLRTIEVNREMAKQFEFPMHLGLTHAGLVEDALVPSAAAIGCLLAEGIGDTIRVSIAGEPVKEVEIGRAILKALGLLEEGKPELIVCPTCGRCEVDVVSLAKKVRRELAKLDRPVRVAVMGCVVNGPGEAADADIAVCAAKGKGFLYRGGKKIATVPEAELMAALAKEMQNI